MIFSLRVPKNNFKCSESVAEELCGTNWHPRRMHICTKKDDGCILVCSHCLYVFCCFVRIARLEVLGINLGLQNHLTVSCERREDVEVHLQLRGAEVRPVRDEKLIKMLVCQLGHEYVEEYFLLFFFV